jgi:serine/threonine-protein kinase HipA
MGHLDYKMKAAHSYSQLLSIATELTLSYTEMEEIFRRMVFNVLARNCDDHTKNFSFRLRQGQPWGLAPAYDITHAYNPSGEWTYQHQMSINGRFKNITREDLMAEASRFSIGTAPKIIEQVKAAISRWREFGTQANMPQKEIDRIAADLPRLK